MHPPISAERWSAARVAYEKTSASGSLIARILGCNRSTVWNRRQKDGWKKKEGSAAARFTAGASAGFDLNGLEALAAGTAPLPGVDGGADASPEAVAAGLDALDRLRVLIGRGANNVVANAEANGGTLDLDALGTLTEAMKVFERAEKLAFPLRLQQQKRSDDELAGTLRIIDDRIVELAEAHARWLVAERDRDREG